MSEPKKSTKRPGGGGRTAGAVLLAALLFGGIGYGIGNGNGWGTGDGSGSAVQPASESSSASEQGSESSEQESNVVVIKIVEDKVYFNEELCEDAEALKAKIEAAYTDKTEFQLDDQNSIKYTYDWVIETFKEAGVTLLIPNQ